MFDDGDVEARPAPAGSMSSALDLSLDDIIASNKPAKGGRGGAGKGKPRGLQVKSSPAIGKKPTRGAGPSVRGAG